MDRKSSDFAPLLVAFTTIYLVWGSTYLANAWAVAMIPPFSLAGTRFISAALLMLGFSRLFGQLDFSWQQVRNAAYAGFFLFAMGNGMVVWALQYVDSGLAALVVAFEPLLVVLLMWKMRAERPGCGSWLGLGLGIVGMVLLVGQPKFVSDANWLFGVLAIFIAIACWGYISIWMTTADLPKSLIQSAALQMLTGGLLLVIMALLNGEPQRWVLPDKRVLLSLAYLILFGSIFAFTAFNYLLTKVSPTLIATSTYVNPVVALLLGWGLNNEEVSLQSAGATILLLAGVVFISLQKRKKRTLEEH
ncbi:MAG: EamA family transporter [Bacteroidota bacterium]